MNIERPEISVAIIAYNHGRYIAEAIKSVLSQTFGDFEMIVLDDGSSDNTREIVGAFIDKRIKYHHQKNSGLPATGRNAGINLTTGKYIAILDGDDMWHKDKLKICKEALDSMADVDLVCHNEEIMYDGKIVRVTSYGPYVKNMYSRLLFRGNCLHTSAVMFRRKIFFDDRMTFCEDRDLFAIEDYEYWLRLSQRYRFHFLPEVLGSYRVTDSGAFLNSDESNSVGMINLLNRHFAMAGKTGISGRLAMKKRLASVMCAAGRMRQHKGDYAGSAKWYLDSLREYPLHYKAAIGLLLARLGLRILYR